jgi:hypothetical protein
MAADQLSECAVALLRHHFSGFSLIMGGSKPESLPSYTLEETQAAYGELDVAGLMQLIDISRDGQTSRYWLTVTAMDRRTEWLSPERSSPVASPGK